MGTTWVKKAAIIGNCLVFILTICIELFAEKTLLLPKKVSEVIKQYPTKLDVTSTTFKIWIFIYIIQCVWIFYTLTLILRKRAPDIIPVQSYVLYSFSRLSNMIWRILVSHNVTSIVPLLLLALETLCQEASLYFIYTRLFRYNQLHLLSADEAKNTSADVWCVRLLVVNGIVFYATWQSIATSISFTRALQYDLGASPNAAVAIALTFLVSATIACFVLENVVFEKFMRFTFMEYIVLVVGGSGMLKRQWTDGRGNQAYILIFLVLACLFFIIRIVLILVKERQVLRTKEKEICIEIE